MEIRDWLILVCILVIAAIAWDAWRRAKAKNSYQGQFTKPAANKNEAVSPVRSRPATEQEIDYSRRSMQLEDDDSEPVPMLMDEFDQSEPLPEYEPHLDAVAIDEPLPESQDEALESVEATPQEQASEQAPVEVDEVLIIHVFAKSGQPPFDGADLLQSLLAANMKHGAMDIFHAHDEQGRLQFSLANGINPGTLNPDTLPEQETPGVSLFLQLPHQGDAKQSLEQMYKVAKYLADEFGAALLDDQRSVLTPQTIEHYQQRITEYQRAQLIPQ